MTEGREGKRALKRHLLEIIRSDDWEERLVELDTLPPVQVINIFISFFCDTDEEIKWRVVTATGSMVSRRATEDMESARVIMRRLMWTLNCESGGIGWGAPEAMGEIMYRNDVLAREFARILVSYAIPASDNFLELPALQRGVLWGLGRLSQAHPELIQDVTTVLPFYLSSDDASLRGLGAWLTGAMKETELAGVLKTLVDDEAYMDIYRDGTMQKRQVRDMAREALTIMEAR